MSFVEFYEILNTDIFLLDWLKSLYFWGIVIFIIIMISVFFFVSAEGSLYISIILTPMLIIASLSTIEDNKLNNNMKELDNILYNNKLNVDQIRLLNKAILEHNKSKYPYSQYANALNFTHESDRIIFSHTEIMDFISRKDKEYFERLERDYYLKEGLEKSISKIESYKMAKESEIESLKDEIERLSNELEAERSNNCFKVCQR